MHHGHNMENRGHEEDNRGMQLFSLHIYVLKKSNEHLLDVNYGFQTSQLYIEVGRCHQNVKVSNIT
jgi:hypothetical protein